MPSLSDIKDAATIFASSLGAVTIVFAVFQYYTAQKWRKNEFLAKEMKEFLGDEKVKEAFRFFDYYGVGFASKIDGKDEVIRVFHTNLQMEEMGVEREQNCVCLISALASGHDITFTEEEQIVRDHIDHYLGYFERICTFLRNGLFKRDDMLPFVQYHVDIFNGLKKHSQGYHDAFFAFLIVYDYRLTLSFLEEFPQSKPVSDAIRDIRAERAGRAN